MGSIKAKARKTACINNMRQIGLALNQYLPDNRYFMPYLTMRPSDPPVNETTYPGLPSILEPHLDGNEVFACPNDDKGYFDNDGLSYEWQSSAINGRKVNNKDMKLFGIEKFILMDYENFHGDVDDAGAKNYLYMNARAVGKLDMP